KALERDKFVLEMTDLKIDAQVLAVEIADAELNHLYLKCLASGFNPLLPREKDLGASDPNFAPDRLVLILSQSSGGRKDLSQQLLVEEMTENLAGMLRWLGLLGLADDKVNWRTLTVAYSLLGEDASKAAREIERLAASANRLYQQRAKKRLAVD